MKKREWKMCGKKVTFKDYERAKQRANHLGLRCYKCPVCKKYHLTSHK